MRDAFHAAFRAHGRGDSRAAKPDALVVIAAEHFANFFMNNMPAFAMGMADHYEGPIEDPGWLGIARTRVPGNAELSQRLIARGDAGRSTSPMPRNGSSTTASWCRCTS